MASVCEAGASGSRSRSGGRGGEDEGSGAVRWRSEGRRALPLSLRGRRRDVPEEEGSAGPEGLVGESDVVDCEDGGEAGRLRLRVY